MSDTQGTKKGLTPRGSPSAIETLKQLITIDSTDQMAIAKTALKDGPRGLAGRAVSIIQHAREMKFGEALLGELEEMRHAGRIRDNFHETEAGASTLLEFFEMIDGKPDEKRFEAFCALFMSANGPNATESEAILDLELMRILGGLTAGEMQLLSGFLRMGTFTVRNPSLVESIMRETGIQSSALVHLNMKALLENGLVNEFTWKNPGGSMGEVKQLLTDLGQALSTRLGEYRNYKDQK